MTMSDRNVAGAGLNPAVLEPAGQPAVEAGHPAADFRPAVQVRAFPSLQPLPKEKACSSCDAAFGNLAVTAVPASGRPLALGPHLCCPARSGTCTHYHDVNVQQHEVLQQITDPTNSSACSATRTHFDDMKERYGGPVVCLDLVKAVEKHPREIVLRSEFDVAISYINQTVRAYAQQCLLLCISGVATAGGAVMRLHGACHA